MQKGRNTNEAIRFFKKGIKKTIKRKGGEDKDRVNKL